MSNYDSSLHANNHVDPILRMMSEDQYMRANAGMCCYVSKVNLY